MHASQSGSGSPNAVVGTHLVADFHDIPPEQFALLAKANYPFFERTVERAIALHNMKLITHVVHHFNDNSSFTSLFLLAESHLSFHSWPERGYIAVDVFTCGNCDTMSLLLDIAAFVKPTRMTLDVIHRGGASGAHSRSTLIRKIDSQANAYLTIDDIADESDSIRPEH
jgi:S-adenosylmethionine decarboxylase